jgi:hypothetical protein
LVALGSKNGEISVAKTKTQKRPADEITIDRRSKDRRGGADRRAKEEPVAVERRQSERRKVPRRRQIDPTTCERDYTTDEIEFMHAMDAYKRASGRMFPTCSEILEVVRHLGYQKPSRQQPAGESDADAGVASAEFPESLCVGDDQAVE